MGSRGRAETVLALMYLLAIPVVVFSAGMVQIAVLDLTASPTLAYEFTLLLQSLPAIIAGALLFMLLRLAAQETVANAALARWPLRTATLVLAAAAPTAMGLWLVLARGHSALNGLIVLPALILWGGLAGEWIAHAWLERGYHGGTLLRSSSFGSAAVIGLLIMSAWILRSPQGELELARRECKAQYARSRTAEDSAFADQWKPTIARELGTQSCSVLLAAERNAAGDVRPDIVPE